MTGSSSAPASPRRPPPLAGHSRHRQREAPAGRSPRRRPGRRSEDTGELIPLDVKVGDTVVYSKYGGTEYILDGEDVLILSARDILAKIA